MSLIINRREDKCDHKHCKKLTSIYFFFFMQCRKDGLLCRGCNLALMRGWYLRMAEAVEACMSSCTLYTDVRAYLTDNCSGSVRSVWICADLCGQKGNSKPDQISNHRVVGSIPALSYRVNLGYERCWAALVRNLSRLYATVVGGNLHAVRDACLGSMSHHSATA